MTASRQTFSSVAALSEELALPVPLKRERLQDLGERCRRPPVQDTLDDVLGEQGECRTRQT
jgi:hypothetical protein